MCLALYVSLCLSLSKEEACTWKTSPSRCPPLLHLRLLLRSDFRLFLDLEDFRFSQNCIICLILTTFSPPRPSRSSPAARPSPPSASSSCSPSPPAWPSWGQSRFEKKKRVLKRGKSFKKRRKPLGKLLISPPKLLLSLLQRLDRGRKARLEHDVDCWA